MACLIESGINSHREEDIARAPWSTQQVPSAGTAPLRALYPTHLPVQGFLLLSLGHTLRQHAARWHHFHGDTLSVEESPRRRPLLTRLDVAVAFLWAGASCSEAGSVHFWFSLLWEHLWGLSYLIRKAEAADTGIQTSVSRLKQLNSASCV